MEALSEKEGVCMKCSDIFNAALRLLNEKESTLLTETDELRDRAPFILATCCEELAQLDHHYRQANGLDSAPPHHAVCLPLSADFPLCKRFAPIAAYYLASLLIADENMTLADFFYDKFSDAVATLTGEIPAVCHKIYDAYAM